MIKLLTALFTLPGNLAKAALIHVRGSALYGFPEDSLPVRALAQLTNVVTAYLLTSLFLIRVCGPRGSDFRVCQAPTYLEGQLGSLWPLMMDVYHVSFAGPMIVFGLGALVAIFAQRSKKYPY